MNDLCFTAIDFETANGNRNSICQVGIGRVENGEIVTSLSFLVQPPNNLYSPWNTCIHNISPDQTIDKPGFPEIWKLISAFFENQLVVAHNSAFDIDCLLKTLEHYELPIPDFKIECTYEMSGLKLSELCEALEIELLHHHHAEHDSCACAQAYIKLKSGHKPDLNKITRKESKSIFEGHTPLSGTVLKKDLENADANSPFFNKKVVFTGVLDTLERTEAASIVKKMGADIDTGISKRTDFVIIGKGAGPSKLKKIEEYNNSGSNIRMVYESEFIELIRPAN